jgi:hypothetical protein
MSSRNLLISALAIGSALTLQAQTPTSKEANRTIPGAITVTGCVERADQVSAPATVGTTVDSLSFVLIHAVTGTAADRQVSGTSGTKANAKDRMYRLDSDTSKLNPHVGHKVEVTGTLDAAAATTASNPDSSSAANAPKLRVERMKMVSETCDR